MTPPLPLAELVKKWRDEAEVYPSALVQGRYAAAAVSMCAAELETALAALPLGRCETCRFWDGRNKTPEHRHQCLAHDGVSELLFCEVDVMWTKAGFGCVLHKPLHSPAPPAAGEETR